MITKFKFWDKDNNEFILFPHNIVLNIDGTVEGIEYEMPREGNVYNDITYFELLQSTGLFDKNEKEIFEGDIVTAMSEGIKGTGVVKRRIDGYWFMYPAWQNGQSWKLVVSEQGDTDVEIIGNKFEHPHLLGED
ncbi:YopX family protein [Mammaliicoccus sciuri]|uniref:YopX family protein n=1 Tax=Mammaliicoccus sciuri TaxID=1296 RepID=UPI001C4E58F7|nr:YopX family protein [Mammaliicoccus sciuri]